ncbi:MAG: hypothetical protein IH602_09575 [Bryobacteraceae bacterium]|nr:hypothetical protein [Bryobacteraceae bacterium]
MTTQFVLLAYLGAFLFAVLCMYLFGQARWYWHVAAIAVALGMGLMPPVQGWQGPLFDMTVGSLFIILFTWGVGEPIYDAMKLPHFHDHHKGHA